MDLSDCLVTNLKGTEYAPLKGLIFVLRLHQTWPALEQSESTLGSPKFRRKTSTHASGLLTPKIKYFTRDNAKHFIAFPFTQQGQRS